MACGSSSTARAGTADGPATSFSPDRFEPVGDYRGFPVYRDKTAARDAIWISVVKDGPLAPYVRR